MNNDMDKIKQFISKWGEPIFCLLVALLCLASLGSSVAAIHDHPFIGYAGTAGAVLSIGLTTTVAAMAIKDNLRK